KISGGESELLLRNGTSLSLTGGDSRDVQKVKFMIPVGGAIDQRRSYAPDGGVAALASFADGSSGIVRVAADGSVGIPVETVLPVPDQDAAAGTGLGFESLNPPGRASGGRFAFLPNVRSNEPQAAGWGATIFAWENGPRRRVLNRHDSAP